MRWIFPLFVPTLAGLCHPVAAAVTADGRAVVNDHVRVEAVGNGAVCSGFRLIVAGKSLATVYLGPSGLITSPWPRAARTAGGAQLVFTPSLDPQVGRLGAASRIAVSLDDDGRWPRLSLSLDLESFSPTGWQKALGAEVPFHYLACRLQDATMFYQGGGLIPSPVVDPFPITTKGFMAGEWSDGWTYAPAMAGWAVPAVGLWNPEAASFVAYDFNQARHTDRSDAYVASACKMGSERADFFCLVHPYQKQWVKLTYPQVPCSWSSHFELLYSGQLPDSADPNGFVLQRLWAERRDLLPPVPRMNDLSWIPEVDSYAPSGKVEPTAAGSGLVATSGSEGLQGVFMEPGATVLGNPFISDGVLRAVATGRADALDKLRQDAEFLMEHCTWVERESERCATWVEPIAGKFLDRWGGERCAGIYHTRNFHIGAGMLLLYEQSKDPRLLPYIDGVYKWCKHYLYTRNGVCDLPWAMFCRAGTAAGENFLLNYRRVFAEDPERGGNCDEALALALTSLYKVLWFYTADPEPDDDLDPTFLNQAVNDPRWCGRVTWNECGWVLRSMVPMYCETGDAFLKYLLRGSVERYYAGFREDGGIAENLQVFGEIEPKGLRTAGFPDACHGGIVRRWAKPCGDAAIRVAMGQSAAIAFCQGTQDLDVDRYAFSPAPGFRFRLVSLSGAEGQAANLIATAPFRDLRELPVRVDGEAVGAERLEYNRSTRGEDIYIRNVPAGAVVEIGDLREAKAAGEEEIPYREAAAEELACWRTVDLQEFCDKSVPTGWWRDGDWYGLTPGLRTVLGLPVSLVDGAQNRGANAVTKGKVPIGTPVRAIAAVFGAPRDAQNATGRLSIHLGDGSTRQLTASSDIPIDLCNGFPLREFETYLGVVDFGADAEVTKVAVLQGTLLALTLARADGAVEGRPDELGEVLARIEGVRARGLAEKAGLQYQTPTKRCEVERPWAAEGLRRRFRLTVPPEGGRSAEGVVSAKEDFALLMRQVGASPFVPRTFEAYEVPSDGRTQRVPVQFDHLPPRGLTQGELLLKLPPSRGEARPRDVDVYFGPGEPHSTPAVSSNVTRDDVTVETGEGGLRFVFALAGDGPGPRWTELRFDRDGNGQFADEANVLGATGFNGGGSDLTCVTDRVTWYDFGGLQTRPASVHVLHQGPLSTTIMISGLEMWGQGETREIATNLGGTSRAGLKGEARWYFRFFAGEPRVDSWLDLRLSKIDTGWTRPLQVRYGLARWAAGDTPSVNGQAYGVTEDLAVLPLLTEATRAQPACQFTPDGNVLQIALMQPDATGEYFGGRWATMPGGMGQETYAGILRGTAIEQFAVEERRPDGIVRRTPDHVAPLAFDSTGGKGPAPKPEFLPVMDAPGALNADPSIESRETFWLTGGGSFVGRLVDSHTHSGQVAADISCPQGGIGMLQTNGRGSRAMPLEPNSVYEVTLFSKCAAGEGEIHVNFYAPGYDFPHASARLQTDGQWHEVRLRVPTGAFVPPDAASVFPAPDELAPSLRIWTYMQAQTVYVDDVQVRQLEG